MMKNKEIDINWEDYLADENDQLLIATPLYDGDYLMLFLLDGWDVHTACQMIVFNRTMEIEMERVCIGDSFCPNLKQIRAYEICCAYDKAKKLADSSVNAGLMKELDSPFSLLSDNYLVWSSDN